MPVEARPRTGRPHQIRAHLAAWAYPLAGDALYGGAPLEGLGRLGLHARSLALIHPTSQAALTFEAPYPPDFAAALQILSG